MAEATVCEEDSANCWNTWAQIVNDTPLVERCRRGDREAQQELFQQTSGRIYRLLLRMTGNREDAFDLAQETYLKGFTQLAKFDGRSSIATWFYRIAVNEALQFLRRGKTMRLKLEDSARSQDYGECLSDATSVQMDVRAALAEIEPSDGVVLLLRYQDGLDYRAMAEVVGCAEGTVASRLSRARDRLRDILRESYDLREGTKAGVHPKTG